MILSYESNAGGIPSEFGWGKRVAFVNDRWIITGLLYVLRTGNCTTYVLEHGVLRITYVHSRRVFGRGRLAFAAR